MRINKRRNAGSPGSDMKESTALLQFTLIGTPVDSMAKRFAWFSTIAPDSFSLEENFKLQLLKTASS